MNGTRQKLRVLADKIRAHELADPREKAAALDAVVLAADDVLAERGVTPNTATRAAVCREAERL